MMKLLKSSKLPNLKSEQERIETNNQSLFKDEDHKMHTI